MGHKVNLERAAQLTSAKKIQLYELNRNSSRKKSGRFSLSCTHAVFCQELWRQRPRSVSHHFVHVAAVTDGVVALVLVHHREALVFVGQVVAAHFEQ